jgi:hypothetical protein
MRPFPFTAALLLSAALAVAAPPQRKFNYQGQLTNGGGNAITGNEQMAFAFWDAASGGNQIASWALTNVPVDRGLFNVELDMPALTTAQLNAGVWLEVTVGGNVLSPRKQILAGVFSYNSDKLQGLQPGTNPGDIPVILTSTGKLDPSILSAPFPLTVSGNGSGAAGLFYNSNPGAGQTGLLGQASGSGVQGQSLSLDGAGVTGYSGYAGPGDTNVGSGVLGVAVNGVGVRGQANAAGTTAIQGLNPLGLGVFGNGLWGAQFGGSLIGVQIGGTGLGGQSAALPAQGLIVNASNTGVIINNSGSGPGLTSDNSGTGVSIQGINHSANGIGVRGEHSGAAFGTGVYGLSNAAGGTGVRGESGATTGSAVGVDGISASSGGVGVRGSGPSLGVAGVSSASVGNGYGVRGDSAGSDGEGVHGVAVGTGQAYGVRGQADNSAGGAGLRGDGKVLGVAGYSEIADSTATGVQGSGWAYGVVGLALNSAGTQSVGVRGSTASLDGYGVLGQALGAGTGAAVGVRGESNAGQGLGVYGLGTAAGVKGMTTAGAGAGVQGDGGTAGLGTERSGVYGGLEVGSGERGYGVYGTATGSGDGYGVYAYVNSPNQRALRAYNAAAGGGDAGYALGIEGKLKIGTNNAGFYVGPAALQTAWDVSCSYCGPGDLVVVTAATDIQADSPYYLANALWVAPNEVIQGSFRVHTHNPVANMRFFYLVIDK